MSITISNLTVPAIITLSDFRAIVAGVDFMAGETLPAEYNALSTHTRTSLFTAVKKRTAIRGKHVRDDQGNVQLDQIAMTNDGQTVFDDAVENAAGDIFKFLSRFATGIDNALEIDTTDIIFHLNVDENYDTDFLTLLDLSVYNALIWYVIADWYKLIGFQDMESAAIQYQMYLAEVRDRANRLFRNVVPVYSQAKQ